MLDGWVPSELQDQIHKAGRKDGKRTNKDALVPNDSNCFYGRSWKTSTISYKNESKGWSQIRKI